MLTVLFNVLLQGLISFAEISSSEYKVFIVGKNVVGVDLSFMGLFLNLVRSEKMFDGGFNMFGTALIRSSVFVIGFIR